MTDPPSNEQRAVEQPEARSAAQRLLRLATIEFVETAPGSRIALAAMRAYVAELEQRFSGGFDVGDGFDPDVLAEMSAPGGTFVVVDEGGATVGCGGVRRVDAATAEVKRMWLSPSVRGLGLGSRLLARLESSAEELGYRFVVLDTNATLTEAISMYDRSGYERVERYNDNPYAQLFFRKELV